MMTRILCLRLGPTYDDVRQGLKRPRPITPRATAFDGPQRAHLAAAMEEFSPHIGWITESQIPCLCLDVSRTAAWFGGEAALLERLQSWCREWHLIGAAAIANTLGSAWAVANYAIEDGQALFASRIVPPQQPLATLAPLPVDALRISLPTALLLKEVGLHTVGALLAIEREALAERFAPELLRRLDQATGHVPELFTAYRPVSCSEIKQSWERGIVSSEILLNVWGSMLPALLSPLVKRGRGVARLLGELIGESHSNCRLVVSLIRPTLDYRHLLDLLRLRLDSICLQEPITGTRLAVLEEASFIVQQQVLFKELSPPIESAAWTLLVERLSGRLGQEAVTRIRPRADHQPEHAWQADPWIRTHIGTSAKPSSAAPLTIDQPAPPRPIWLLPTPRAIRVLALAPQGYPQRFTDVGRELRVVQSWGPERIETGWWRGPSIRRDYYRVETELGTRCWLFRNLRSRRWFLHGWFD